MFTSRTRDKDEKLAYRAARRCCAVITAAQVQALAAQGIAANEFEELLAAIGEGATYANVHTAKYGGGEIRGQILQRDRH